MPICGSNDGERAWILFLSTPAVNTEDKGGSKGSPICQPSVRPPVLLSIHASIYPSVRQSFHSSTCPTTRPFIQSTLGRESCRSGDSGGSVSPASRRLLPGQHYLLPTPLRVSTAFVPVLLVGYGGRASGCKCIFTYTCFDGSVCKRCKDVIRDHRCGHVPGHGYRHM